MSPLHTVNKSPFSSTALASCLAHATDDAAILLIEDGVYAALAAAQQPEPLKAAAARGAVYALEPDLIARGLADAPLIAGMKRVDYAGFVDLTATHSSVMAWV
ncbi:MAG TPA: sulfurtransferase complex subunit TusB [Magnetospirillaceae bacterium]|jgi:tRNA 2-thiouridine synthesizing protein B